jgi:hypothetical protein
LTVAPDPEPRGTTTQRLEPARKVFRPEFRQRLPGEVRAYGVFTGVECTPTGIVLEVRVPGSTLRARSPKFDEVEFISYQPKPPAPISCGPRTPPEEVYVTWRPAAAGDGSHATAVAVELLPEGFVPEP